MKIEIKIPRYILIILILDFLLIAADHLILLSTKEQTHVAASRSELAEGYTPAEKSSNETLEK
jgi:hypothetical protein